MSEQTLHFDNLREAQALTGHHHRLLPAIGEALGVQLTARDTWLQIQGEPGPVDRARAFFEFIRRARNSGAQLREQGMLYALRAFVRGEESNLERMYGCRIEVSPGKAPVFPRTFGQRVYVEAVRDKDICFGTGPAGTGKTYLAMALAVSALLKGDVSRIILTRPAIEAGESLGFLPGDLYQKVGPYLRPLHDALYDMMSPAEIERNMERGVIEVAPLAYMRGRTLNHAFVILDEAQNTTPEQMMMFLTRLGFDSKCVVTGDPTQIDLPSSKMSGLLEAARALRNIEDIVFVEFDEADVVRHEVVQRIVKAYRLHRAGRDRPDAGRRGPA